MKSALWTKLSRSVPAIFIVGWIAFGAASAPEAAGAPGRNPHEGSDALSLELRLRLIIETDAGGDPDDEQSLVRFPLLHMQQKLVMRRGSGRSD